MSTEKGSEAELQQLDALIRLYEHHLDLFWKWITLYVTVVSATSVYIFNRDITPSTKRLFPILIAVFSLGIAFGCLLMWSWLREVEREVKRISAEVRSARYPSFLGIRMTVAAFFASLAFAVFNVLYTAYGSFQ